ncbi:hypothetical protein [Candidatus Nephthysia bennettiae]|uniref:Uncharacterized protein n=1 Tax=Candidatus Nephthysia bennettiae TaxID=3127016 RepID=A0A934K7G0_9BACT|nr:hypothetical protein [Candidatus Dormibacteraeota bacterium]MBJ7614799.1 hypothetical protein [Candidatus Dormibacteraeota bacterium]
MGLTAESLEFVRERPGSHRLEVALAPLGHVRSRQAPAGLVIARTLEASVRQTWGGLQFAWRPALRGRSPGGVSTPSSAGARVGAAAAVPLEPSSEPPQGDPTTDSEAGGDLPTDAPAPPEGAWNAPPQQAANPSQQAAPQPRAARVVAQAIGSAADTSHLTRAPEPSPLIQAGSPRSVQRSEPPNPSEAPATESRLNLGQSRRLGLGLPLQRPPAGRTAAGDIAAEIAGEIAGPAASGEIAREPAPATVLAQTAAEAAEAPSPVQAFTADPGAGARQQSPPAAAAPSDVSPQPGPVSSVGDVRAAAPSRERPSAPPTDPSASFPTPPVARLSTPQSSVSPPAVASPPRAHPRSLGLGPPIRREPPTAQRMASGPPPSAPPPAGPPGSPTLHQPRAGQGPAAEPPLAAETAGTLGEGRFVQPSVSGGGSLGDLPAAEEESPGRRPPLGPAQEPRPMAEGTPVHGGPGQPRSEVASGPAQRMMRPIVRVQRRRAEVSASPRPEAPPPLSASPTSPRDTAGGASPGGGGAADAEAQDPPAVPEDMREAAHDPSDQPRSQAVPNPAEPAAAGPQPGWSSVPATSVQGWFGTVPPVQRQQHPGGIGRVLHTGRSSPAFHETGPQPRETVRPIAAASHRPASLEPLVHLQPVAQRLPPEGSARRPEPAVVRAGAGAEAASRAWSPGPPPGALSPSELPVARFAEVRAPRIAAASPGRHEVSGTPVQPLIHLHAPPPYVPPPPIQASHSEVRPQEGAVVDPLTPATLTVSRQADGAPSAAEAVAGGGATHGEGAGGRSETELDELAGRLYDRFRSRLRMELLVSRERAGLATDLR